MLWFDQVLTAVILVLTIFAPLTLGATHAWAFVPLEAAIFVLFGAAALKPCPPHAALGKQIAAPDLRPMLLPLALFVALIAIEILPMPPAVERWIAPSTYRLYQTVLPNWPRLAPYLSLPVKGPQPHFVLLPSEKQVQNGAKVPFSKVSSSATRPGKANADFDGGPGVLLQRVLGEPTWRTLSVAPAITQEGFLKVAALAGLFVLVLVFPFEPGGEQRFERAIVKGVVLTAAAISLVGIYGSASNNRLILAIFNPYDWHGIAAWNSRSTGTFANPDHFAAYLSFALPACVASVLHPGAFASSRGRVAYRLLAAVAGIAVVAALVVTQSRGGWTDAVLGLATLAAMLQSWQRRTRHDDCGRSGAWLWGVVVALILVAFLLLGSRGAYQFDSRLQETATQESLWARMAPTRQSLKMIADFPLFGVGLGCWPQLYPRYTPAPWMGVFFNAAHNDYAQLGGETGLLGFGLMALALVAAIRRLYSGFKRLPLAAGPLFAALVAPLTGLAVHESFDFPLQIPANALIFTLFLAIAVRMARESGAARPPKANQGPSVRPWPWLSVGIVAGLLVAALTQSTGAPYPFSIAQAVSPTRALAAVRAYPADARAHLNFVLRLNDRLDLDHQQHELKIALFLDPNNPFARDHYADSLLKQGRVAQALNEIRKSVFLSPMLATHWYTDGELLPLLPAAVQGAIASGLQEAMAQRWQGVANELGGFYEELNQPAKAADAFVLAADEEATPATRAVQLARAGSLYLRAGLSAAGIATLRESIQANPTDPQSYRYLLTGVYGPRKDLAEARQLVNEGVEAGADPFSLYVGLADAAEIAGDDQRAETALAKALEYQPGDVGVMSRLGSIYRNDGQFDQAAYWMRKVAQAQPHSAEVFYALAQAEDQNYDYSAADKAYAEAVNLAPSNVAYRQGYSAFKRKAAAALDAHPSP